jgi:AbrB family looped-hinge helix DNA binding protein
MNTAARFKFKIHADEKAIVAKAAALPGTTMAGSVRVAAKVKAQLLLDREARLTLSRGVVRAPRCTLGFGRLTLLVHSLYDIHNRKEGVRMSEPTTISSKGQVTVPRDVRERLGLQAGDKIAWSMLSNGTIVLRPKTRRLADLVGILTQPGQPSVSVDEMRLPE